MVRTFSDTLYVNFGVITGASATNGRLVSLYFIITF